MPGANGAMRVSGTSVVSRSAAGTLLVLKRIPGCLPDAELRHVALAPRVLTTRRGRSRVLLVADNDDAHRLAVTSTRRKTARCRGCDTACGRDTRIAR